jgi:hypothetical protein
MKGINWLYIWLIQKKAVPLRPLKYEAYENSQVKFDQPCLSGTGQL